MIAIRDAGDRTLRRAVSVVAGRRFWLDIGFTALVLAALELEALTSPHRRGPVLVNALVVGVMAAAAAWRGRMPLISLSVVAVGAIALSQGLTAVTASYGTLIGLYCVLVPTYAVATWEPQSRAIFGLGLWLLVVAVVGAVDGAPLAAVLPVSLTGTAAWVAGRVMRGQRSLAADLDRKLARLAEERAERTRRAVTAERLRIARDLQGAVIEAVTEMVVQARAAECLIDEDDARAQQALDRVEVTGREALGEMRRILGLLRRPTDGPGVSPPVADDDLCRTEPEGEAR